VRRKIVTISPQFRNVRVGVCAENSGHQHYLGMVPYGLLISYGPDLTDYFRKAAGYADKIPGGAKPADLPVEQPTRLKQVLDLKTAKALGLTIPPALLIGAEAPMSRMPRTRRRHARAVSSQED
jgi:putative ABC transport system substrate-binding protein